MTTQERLLSLIDREVGKPATLESTFEALSVDSLEFVCLMQAIEEEFGVTIPDAEYVSLNKVGDLLRLL